MSIPTPPYSPVGEGATWRDPLDWWFLLSGVGLRCWCSLWAGVAAAHAEWRSWSSHAPLSDDNAHTDGAS